MPDRTDILSWPHIGDLPITRAGEENHRDLPRIVDWAHGLAPGHGRAGQDQGKPAGAGWTPPPRRADGGDGGRIGARPETGIFNTPLGPIRNGRTR